MALIQELRILRHRPLTKHPNFPKIVDIAWEYDALDLQRALPTIGTEFAAWGTLDSFFLTLPEPDWPMKSRLLLDVVEGLSALHSCKIVHGDIKMENVLVFAYEGDPNFPVIAKLSDFGFCVDVSESAELQSLIGYTPLWAAPEASQSLKKECLYLTDVYSLGFIIWSICLGGRKPSDEVLTTITDQEESERAWTSLKESDEMVAVAKASLGERSLTMPMNIWQATQYLDWTLQHCPDSRQLRMVLSMLRSKGYKRRAEEIPSEDTYHPLTPLKGNLVCHASA
jgi:serine/threonine protein kinase